MNHGEVGGRRDFFFTLGIPRGDSTYKKPSPFFLPIYVLCHALTWAVNAQPIGPNETFVTEPSKVFVRDPVQTGPVDER